MNKKTKEQQQQVFANIQKKREALQTIIALNEDAGLLLNNFLQDELEVYEKRLLDMACSDINMAENFVLMHTDCLAKKNYLKNLLERLDKASEQSAILETEFKELSAQVENNLKREQNFSDIQ